MEHLVQMRQLRCEFSTLKARTQPPICCVHVRVCAALASTNPCNGKMKIEFDATLSGAMDNISQIGRGLENLTSWIPNERLQQDQIQRYTRAIK